MTRRGRPSDWVDRVIAIAANGSEVTLAEISAHGRIGPGASYAQTKPLTLPPGMTGRYTLAVRTDAAGAVFENGLEANNTACGPGVFDVMPIPYADLSVRRSRQLGRAASGKPLTVSWSIVNDGNWADQRGCVGRSGLPRAQSARASRKSPAPTPHSSISVSSPWATVTNAAERSTCPKG